MGRLRSARGCLTSSVRQRPTLRSAAPGGDPEMSEHAKAVDAEETFELGFIGEYVVSAMSRYSFLCPGFDEAP